VILLFLVRINALGSGYETWGWRLDEDFGFWTWCSFSRARAFFMGSLLSSRPDSRAGLTNSTHFDEIRRIRTGPNLKIVEFTVYCLIFLEKDKNQQKYM
jgi:hypothetical protein